MSASIASLLSCPEDPAPVTHPPSGDRPHPSCPSCSPGPAIMAGGGLTHLSYLQAANPHVSHGRVCGCLWRWHPSQACPLQRVESPAELRLGVDITPLALAGTAPGTGPASCSFRGLEGRPQWGSLSVHSLASPHAR